MEIKAEWIIQSKITKEKLYLRDTDYIALKIAEADDNKKEALKQLYKEELAKREECRKRINELEKELNSAVASE